MKINLGSSWHVHSSIDDLNAVLQDLYKYLLENNLLDFRNSPDQDVYHIPVILHITKETSVGGTYIDVPDTKSIKYRDTLEEMQEG